jgi:plasmid stability protein
MSADASDAERNAEHWRKLEAEARTIARTKTDPEPRRIMLFIAEGYKLLANRAGLRNVPKH